MSLPTAVPVSKSTRPAAPPNVILTLLLGVLLVVGAWLAWRILTPPALPGIASTADQVEAQWGVRLEHIAVLADGGLIDFRLRVIDPDKAGPLFSLEKRPVMIIESTGQRVDSLYHPNMGHGVTAGQSVYFIYNDSHGLLKPGTVVSVLLGDLRLEHIVVQ